VDALDLDADLHTLEASQIVLHNLNAHEVVVRGAVAAGALNASGIPTDRADVSDLRGVGSGEWLVAPSGEGRLRAPGAEVARLQCWGRVAASDGTPDPAVIGAASAVYDQLRLESVSAAE
jgi:hypothetical protein